MQAEYNILLVGLSFLISVFGSYTALQLAIGIPQASGRSLFLWLSGAAVALGGGAIWAMHFIGMLAHEAHMSVTYDIPLTLVSLFVAVFVVGLGLFIVGKGGGRSGVLLLGGVITGLGVASMHYMGMSAMRMPATIEYNNMLVGVSVIIAIVAATAALWLAFNLRGNWQRIGSALIMGVAVCGMHYTGMAAATMVHTDAPSLATSTAMNPNTLAAMIFVISTGLLFALLFLALKQVKAQDEYTYHHQ